MALQEATVISHHSHTHRDKFQGLKFEFTPNKKVLVPLAAAVHFFGLGLADKSPAWKRHGFTDSRKGEDYLRKFELKVVDLVPEDTDVEKIKGDHAETLNKLGSDHQMQLAEVEANGREEMQRIMTTHDEEVRALQARIAELEATPAPDGKSQKKAK